MAERHDRSVVLVTGMSGTGKSTMLEALGRRGHRVIDTDAPGWIVHVEASSGIEPLWDLDRSMSSWTRTDQAGSLLWPCGVTTIQRSP